MFHAEHIRLNIKKLTRLLALLLSSIMLLGIIYPLFNRITINVSAEDNINRLLNGSFEDKQSFTSSYAQINQADVPSSI